MSDSIVRRKPLKSISGYPYRAARIVTDSKWHVVFYAWNVTTEKLERKRVLHDEFSDLHTEEKKLSFGEKIAEEINYFLKRDWHLESNRKAVKLLEEDFRGYSILEGFKYALNYLLTVKGTSQETVDKYTETVDTLREFLVYKKIPLSYGLSNLTVPFAQAYFEYIKTIRLNGNGTYNYKKGVFSTLTNILLDKSPKLLNGRNPFSKIKKLKTQSRKHAAYTDTQLKQIVDHFTARRELQIILFIQFMYYSLARGGKELAGLRVGNIHMERRQLFFKADDAKTDIEDYVGINDRFAKIIDKSGVLNYPAHYYIFSNQKKYYINLPERKEINREEFKSLSWKQRKALDAEMIIEHGPGPVKVGKNYFYKRITEAIEALDLYKINPNFTPYAVKHTGAIALYLATKNIDVVMRQCRHQDLETTIKYLRDLGVFTDISSELNKLNGAI